MSAQTKRCRACDETKPAAEFHRDTRKPDGLSCYCKPCAATRRVAWQSQPGNYEKAAEHRRQQRERVLAYYGGKCACCGETRHEFLAIDHIDGGGAKHRRSERGASCATSWLIKHNFPTGFQVLCHNCNMAKGFYGVCPHTQRPALRLVG